MAGDETFALEETAPGPASADVPTVRSGTKLGRYRVDRLIGQGGMGSVYAGVHAALGKTVAIKVLDNRIAGLPQARARFLREGQAACRIQHEHVVDVFDVGVEGDIPYLVMEHLEGESLASLLSRRKSLSPLEASDLMVPVADALAAAHDLGVIHRDLKPENIFLCSDDPPRPKVLDFGISKLVDGDDLQGLTGSAAFLGTPFYVSPEQSRNAQDIDARTDQYSFGVVLYEMVTGTRPFAGAALYPLLQRIVAGEFAPPREVVKALPAEFESIILKAMSREPGLRFESMRALGAGLLPFASDRTRIVFDSKFAGVDSRASSHRISVRTRAPNNRRRWIAGVALLAGGLTAFGLHRLRQPASSESVAHAGAETPAAPARHAPASIEAAPRAPARVPVVKRVESVPSGAELSINGAVVGRTPMAVEIPSDASVLRIELRARNFEPVTHDLLRESPDLTKLLLQPAQSPVSNAPRPKLAPR